MMNTHTKDQHPKLNQEAIRLIMNDAGLLSRLLQWAHDIRSPLLSLKVLAKSVDEMSPEAGVLLKHAVSRVQNMTEEILAEINSVSSHHTQNQQRQESLASLIDKVVSIKWLELDDRPGVTIETRLGQRARDLKVALAPLAFERMLSNLLNNSIQSINRSGVITISTSATETEALLMIEDNGCGISADKLVDIQNNVLTSSGKANGMGLGLAQARMQIAAIGGSFEIDSVPGSGTALKIRLPLLIESLS